MPYQPSRTMRVLGTSLPSTQTVHERVFGPMPRGRPIAVPPKNLKLAKDKSRPQNYRLLWQKMKPEVIKRADDVMGTYMPPGLSPQALSYVNARNHRRSHG